MILFQTGMALTIFGILYYFYDVRKRNRQDTSFIMRVYNRTSGFSLTFYFMHYMLIGWTLAVVWFITGKYYMTDLMGSIPALFCGIAAVILLELILAFWEKRRGKYSLEWFLGALTQRFASK
jgi:magnesium-transporting ATPase (P-type)